MFLLRSKKKTIYSIFVAFLIFFEGYIVNAAAGDPVVMTEAWRPSSAGVQVANGGIVNYADIDQAIEKVTIYSTASDDSGIIQNHKIRWWKNGVLQPVSSWSTGGIHQLVINGPLAQGDLIEYQSEATDGAGNMSLNPSAGRYSFLVSAPQCCPASGACTIITNPCTLNGNYSGLLGNLTVNTNTAAPLRIILTGNVAMSAYSDVSFDNQLAGANRQVVIIGAAPSAITRNGYSLSISNNGNFRYAGEGMAIDLSVPETSTGNGGSLTISSNGLATVPSGSDIKIYTYGGNANNLSGFIEPKGGDINLTLNGAVNFSAGSLIQTGTLLGNLTKGGDITISNNGNVTNGSAGLLSSSSSDIAGNITASSNGDMSLGAHANGGNQGGTIDLHGNGNYYAPACNGSVLEAKNNGNINLGMFRLLDIPPDTITVGGTLNVNAMDLTNCSCLAGGGSCYTLLVNNNSTVNMNASTCDESDPLAICSGGAIPSFDYSLSNSGDIMLTQNSSGSRSVTATLVSGTSQAVDLFYSITPNEPAIVLSWVSGNSVFPTSSKFLSISAGATTPVGTYAITITGNSTSIPDKQTVIYLKVNESMPIGSCPGITNPTDVDGNIYNTVQVGTQCWMKENLNVTKNPSGVPIARYCYNDSAVNCNTYGGLYKKLTMMDGSLIDGAQGICPIDWHIPKDSEWYALENGLASGSCNPNRSGGDPLGKDCDPAGTKLKMGGSTGFEGMLGGYYSVFAPNYSRKDSLGFHWSSTDWSGRNLFRALISTESTVDRNAYFSDNSFGFSVRCIYDNLVSNVPSKVPGLTATAGNTQVVLNWTAPFDGGLPITSYKVYRSTISGAGVLLAAGGCYGLGNVLTCTDSGLTNGTTYYYKVSALNAIGEGSQSDEVSATPIISAVPNFVSVDANVMGYAWSENIGWISFNNRNCDTNNDGFSEAPNAACPMASDFTQGYGVKLDLNITSPSYNQFSGYAWSSNIGWISFNWDTIKDSLPLAECPDGNGEVFCRPKLTGTNFSGWARACGVFQLGCSGALKPDNERGGWNGWIKLRKDPIYGVSLLGSEFMGYAWGNDVTGWLSFNSRNCDTDLDLKSEGGVGCPALDSSIPRYKVYLAGTTSVVPTVSNLTVAGPLEPCKFNNEFQFSWDYSSASIPFSPQKSYQIRVYDGAIPVYDTGKLDSATNSVTLILGNGVFNKTLNWTLMVWDSTDLPSALTPGLGTFTALNHQYPDVDFSPPPPGILSTTIPIQFCSDDSIASCASNINKTICYDINNNPVECASWSWDFGDGNTDNVKNPVHTYFASGSYEIILQVTDSLGAHCTNLDSVGQKILGSVKPKWREVVPR